MKSRAGSTFVSAIFLLLATALCIAEEEHTLLLCSEPRAKRNPDWSGARADSAVPGRVRLVDNRYPKTESALDDAPGAFDRLKRTQDAFRAVAQRLRPSLVRIETVGGSQPPAILLADPDNQLLSRKLSFPAHCKPQRIVKLDRSPLTGEFFGFGPLPNALNREPYARLAHAKFSIPLRRSVYVAIKRFRSAPGIP